MSSCPTVPWPALSRSPPTLTPLLWVFPNHLSPQWPCVAITALSDTCHYCRIRWWDFRKTTSGNVVPTCRAFVNGWMTGNTFFGKKCWASFACAYPRPVRYSRAGAETGTDTGKGDIPFAAIHWNALSRRICPASWFVLLCVASLHYASLPFGNMQKGGRRACVLLDRPFYASRGHPLFESEGAPINGNRRADEFLIPLLFQPICTEAYRGFTVGIPEQSHIGNNRGQPDVFYLILKLVSYGTISNGLLLCVWPIIANQLIVSRIFKCSYGDLQAFPLPVDHFSFRYTHQGTKHVHIRTGRLDSKSGLYFEFFLYIAINIVWYIILCETDKDISTGLFIINRYARSGGIRYRSPAIYPWHSFSSPNVYAWNFPLPSRI